MGYEVRVIDRWDLLQKDVYVYQRTPEGTYLLQDGNMVLYPTGQSFEGSPTFSIDNQWEEELARELLGGRITNEMHQQDLVRRLLKEEERVDKMLDRLLE